MKENNMAKVYPVANRKNLMHIEADGCIVNIREGLTDMKGRQVTSIEVIPDDMAGEQRWKRVGYANTRVVQLKGR